MVGLAACAAVANPGNPYAAGPETSYSYEYNPYVSYYGSDYPYGYYPYGYYCCGLGFTVVDRFHRFHVNNFHHFHGGGGFRGGFHGGFHGGHR
jgi:hypothetical protein